MVVNFIYNDKEILMQVVEAEFRYDETCLSPDVAKDAVAYIKSDTTNKTCTHKWIVSTFTSVSQEFHFSFLYLNGNNN